MAASRRCRREQRERCRRRRSCDAVKAGASFLGTEQTRSNALMKRLTAQDENGNAVPWEWWRSSTA
eukprot:2450259-Rhodomonas_salina.3